MLSGIADAQEKNLLRAYQDSLSAVEDKLDDLSKLYSQKQMVLKQVTLLLQIEDLARIEESTRPLLEVLGDDGLELRKVVDKTQKVLAELAILKGKIDGAQDRLVKLDQAKAKSKDLEASLVKQILRDQRALDSTRTAFMIEVRLAINGIKRWAEEEARNLGKQQDRLERSKVELKQKLEMESLFVDISQNILTNPPRSPVDLIKGYAQLIEAQERDPSHSYDALFAAARRLAEQFFTGVLATRFRDARVLVPAGECILSSGKSFRTSGLVVSSVPLSQIDVSMSEIANGNRSKNLLPVLKTTVDRPAEEIPEATLKDLMTRYESRPISGEEREYIELSGFESLSEKAKYGVMTSLYGFSPNPRHVYICWDQDLRDPTLETSIRERSKSIDSQRRNLMHDAWRTGQVWNPRRLVVDINPMALGYFISFTPSWTTSRISVLGAGLARVSVLLGYRYGISGTEATGERYGFVGLQVSHMRTFDRVRKTSGKSKAATAGDFETEVTRLDIKGEDVALVLTLGRAIYVGFGVGNLTSEISAMIIAPNGFSYPAADYRESNYYFCPVGILARVGTGFAFNVGGTILWKGLFDRPSFTAGLGFNIDLPLVRFRS